VKPAAARPPLSSWGANKRISRDEAIHLPHDFAEEERLGPSEQDHEDEPQRVLLSPGKGKNEST
jgi:hypothetical protein